VPSSYGSLYVTLSVEVEENRDFVWYNSKVLNDRTITWDTDNRLTGTMLYSFILPLYGQPYNAFNFRFTTDSSIVFPSSPLSVSWYVEIKCGNPCSSDELEIPPCIDTLVRKCIPLTTFTTSSGTFNLESTENVELAWVIKSNITDLTLFFESNVFVYEDFLWYKTNELQDWSTERRVTGSYFGVLFSHTGYFAIRITADGLNLFKWSIKMRWLSRCSPPCTANEIEAIPCTEIVAKKCIPVTTFTAISGNYTLAAYNDNEDIAWQVNTN
jgi:hypothetical protein